MTGIAFAPLSQRIESAFSEIKHSESTVPPRFHRVHMGPVTYEEPHGLEGLLSPLLVMVAVVVRTNETGGMAQRRLVHVVSCVNVYPMLN